MSAAQDRSIDRQLDELQATGRQLLVAAHNSDWRAVGSLQLQCHRLAEALFARPISAGDSAEVARCAGRLLAIHDEVRHLCLDARKKSMQEIDGLSQGRHAVSEYAANSG